jgi:hypothetical protein
MPGPWDKYSAAPQESADNSSGPWAKYSETKQPSTFEKIATYQTWPERMVRGAISGIGESLKAGATLTKEALTDPAKYSQDVQDPAKVLPAASLGVTAAPAAGEAALNVAKSVGRAGEQRQIGAALKTEATPEKIKESSQASYRAVAEDKLQIKPQHVSDFVDDAQSELKKKLITPNRAEGTYSALEQLKEGGGDISQLMDLHEALGEMTPADGKDYAAANMVRKKIDTFLDGLNEDHVISGDPKYTKAMLDHARASWRPYAKMTEIEKGVEVAGHRAAATGTGANIENTLRQEIRKILDSDKRSRGYSPEAKAKMEEIVQGTFASNLARKVGKYAPTGAVSALPSILAYLARGKLMAGSVAGAGFLGKYLGEALTRQQISKLEDLIAAESPLGRSVVKRMQSEPQGTVPEGIALGARAMVPALSAGAVSPLAQPGQ